VSDNHLGRFVRLFPVWVMVVQRPFFSKENGISNKFQILGKACGKVT